MVQQPSRSGLGLLHLRGSGRLGLGEKCIGLRLGLCQPARFLRSDLLGALPLRPVELGAQAVDLGECARVRRAGLAETDCASSAAAAGARVGLGAGHRDGVLRGAVRGRGDEGSLLGGVLDQRGGVVVGLGEGLGLRVHAGRVVMEGLRAGLEVVGSVRRWAATARASAWPAQPRRGAGRRALGSGEDERSVMSDIPDGVGTARAPMLWWTSQSCGP